MTFQPHVRNTATAAALDRATTLHNDFAVKFQQAGLILLAPASAQQRQPVQSAGAVSSSYR